MKRFSAILILFLLWSGCGPSEDAGDGPLDGVQSIVFIQRPARGGQGDIFNYTSYLPGARLVKLTPPTADGTLEVLCCDQNPEFAEADISGYDISFDAREIVFAAKLSDDQRYGLFVLTLEDGNIEQLPTDPNRDYIMPVFMPGDRIFYSTNAVIEEGAPQFRDEYERRVTAQIGTIGRDGSDDALGARNLSHRVFGTLLSDGRVMITQWDHLGEMNSGHLVIANPDMSNFREAFGKEGTGVTNSYYKASEISPGRVLAIGSARSRTVQSGTILDIRLGETYEQDGEIRADRNMSEANASYRILTPQVPRGNEPSSMGIGRYYDATALNAKDYPDLLVSWANGPVESGTLDAAGLPANFGIFLYDSKAGARRPIYDNPDMWDVFARPLVSRDAPPMIPAAGGNSYSDEAVLIGSTNVYESSLQNFDEGSIYGVRILEGYSVEEGAPNDFGLTEHEGMAYLGVAPVYEDGSWAALIPPNIPVRHQVIDKFGMSLRSEPVWVSGTAGEAMVCNGCHEDRASAPVIAPGVTIALGAEGPTDLRSELTRTERKSESYSIDDVIGVPWDKALQPIFDAKCVSCHEGTPSAANPSFTITDMGTGEVMEWAFDLRGDAADYGVGDAMMSAYSASHLSLMGPGMADLQEAGLVIDGEPPVYIEPTNARGSKLFEVLNPPQLFPTVNTDVRAFEGPTHAEAQGFEDLTADEYYLLILASDGGGQFFSRENLPVSE